MSGIHLQVRPSDCDAFGHVNNAVYVSFIQHAMADTLAHLGFSMDWHRDGDSFWELKSVAIEYRRPAAFGDALTAYIWLEQPDQTHPAFGCEIKAATGEGSQQSVCRSRSVWNSVSRQSEKPFLLPESFLANFPGDAGVLPRPFDLPPDSPKFRNYYWDHNVMVSELGPNGRVHPQAVYNWLQDSVFRASEQAG